jgi:hypothetical protein
VGSSRSRTILRSAEARGQGAREHGTHADPVFVFRCPAAESRTSQIRCTWKLRDYVARPGRRCLLDALGVTLHCQFGIVFPTLPRQPSLRILLGARISVRGQWVRLGRLVMNFLALPALVLFGSKKGGQGAEMLHDLCPRDPLHRTQSRRRAFGATIRPHTLPGIEVGCRIGLSKPISLLVVARHF